MRAVKKQPHLEFSFDPVQLDESLRGSGLGSEWGKKIAGALSGHIINAVKDYTAKGSGKSRAWRKMDYGKYKYGSGFFDAIGDAFRAIPAAFRSVPSGVKGAIDNKQEVISRVNQMVDAGQKAKDLVGKVMPIAPMIMPFLGRGQKGKGIFSDLGGMLGSKAGGLLGGMLGFGKPKKAGKGKLAIPKVYVNLSGAGKIEDIAKMAAEALGGYLGNQAENLLNMPQVKRAVKSVADKVGLGKKKVSGTKILSGKKRGKGPAAPALV